MFDKNLNKYFNVKNNVPFVIDMLNLGNNSTDLIKVDKHENKNLLKDVFEKDDQYKFIKDEDIIDSFQKVFHDYNVVYTPYKKSKNIYVKCLLDKLNVSNNVSMYLKFKNKKIPVEYTDDGQMLLKGKIVKQTGEGNIRINNKVLV